MKPRPVAKIVPRAILILLFLTPFSGFAARNSVKTIYSHARNHYHSLMKKKSSHRERWLECADEFKNIYTAYPRTEFAVKSFFSEANLFYELYKVSSKKSDLSKSERLYLAFVEKYPVSRFADDALLQVGKIKLKKGDKSGARHNLKLLVETYPKGDMQKKARKMLEKLPAPKPAEKRSPPRRTSALSAGGISDNGNGCVIVIDPGHGGKDVGAVGVNGIFEKNIILDISKRMKSKIEKHGACKVIMTRKKDVFIPLSKRTAIANSSNATLFISIHANASRNEKVSGVETFYQGLPGTQAEKETAARENMVSIKQEFSTKDDMLGFILSDMKNTYLINESSHLADVIQNHLVKGISLKFSGTKNLGVKQALFYVLHGARMPSILVEVSFITNPREGKRLGEKTYRESIAGSLYKGIIRYIEQRSRVALGPE